MKVKILELRDDGTFIALLAIDMNPDKPYPDNGSFATVADFKDSVEASASQLALLLREGYPCDGRPNVAISRLTANDTMSNDPYSWGGRTMPVAHAYIIEHWNELKDGDVVDVQFILGETAAPKVSERIKPYGETP